MASKVVIKDMTENVSQIDANKADTISYVTIMTAVYRHTTKGMDPDELIEFKAYLNGKMIEFLEGRVMECLQTDSQELADKGKPDLEVMEASLERNNIHEDLHHHVTIRLTYARIMSEKVSEKFNKRLLAQWIFNYSESNRIIREVFAMDDWCPIRFRLTNMSVDNTQNLINYTVKKT